MSFLYMISNLWRAELLRIVSGNRDQRMSHVLLPLELSFLSKLFVSPHNINILDFVYIFPYHFIHLTLNFIYLEMIACLVQLCQNLAFPRFRLDIGYTFKFVIFNLNHKKDENQICLCIFRQFLIYMDYFYF